MIYDALGYYKILEVDVLADDKTIKIKYRDKAKQWHPDHNESENALEIFQKISVAYDILKDNKTRTMYDMLSMVYTQKEFPDFQTLKIYKDNEGKENPFLRVLRLYKYTKKGFKMEKPVVSYNDAIDVINKITKENWLKGWVKPKENLKALKYNKDNLNKNAEDNFKMLIHRFVVSCKIFIILCCVTFIIVIFCVNCATSEPFAPHIDFINTFINMFIPFLTKHYYIIFYIVIFFIIKWNFAHNS